MTSRELDAALKGLREAGLEDPAWILRRGDAMTPAEAIIALHEAVKAEAEAEKGIDRWTATVQFHHAIAGALETLLRASLPRLPQ